MTQPDGSSGLKQLLSANGANTKRSRGSDTNHDASRQLEFNSKTKRRKQVRAPEPGPFSELGSLAYEPEEFMPSAQTEKSNEDRNAAAEHPVASPRAHRVHIRSVIEEKMPTNSSNASQLVSPSSVRPDNSIKVIEHPSGERQSHLDHARNSPPSVADPRKPSQSQAGGAANQTGNSEQRMTTPTRLTSPMRLDQQHFQQLRDQHGASGSLSNKSHANNFNYALALGLPVSSCIILMILLGFIYNYCKKLRKQQQLNKEKQRQQQQSKKIPISFLSGGKVLSGLIAKGTGRSKSPLDSRQLTINMESEGSSSNDDTPGPHSSPTADQESNSATKQQHQQLKANRNGVPAGQQHSKKTSSEAKGPKKKRPSSQLKYSLSYDFNKSILTVNILEARDLPGLDLCGSSDPYVKVFLVPDQDSKSGAQFQTKIHKRTLNPIFNEQFQFPISYGELNSKTLVMSVYDYDRFSRHDEIGEVSLPIGGIDLSQTQEQWAELYRTTKSAEGQLGDICLSLRYVPTAGRLTVIVLEARQLKKMDLAGLSDPYVKLVLVNEHGKRLKKKKTSIKKCTLNPHYNESFSFEIPFDQVQHVQLVVTVVDYDRIGTSEPIGKIVLGCRDGTTGETETRHWMDMLASPRRPIAQWHSLKELDSSDQLTAQSKSSSG